MPTMSTNGAVGALSQFWLWRLELRVASTLIAVVALVAIVTVTAVFGLNAGVGAAAAFYVGVALVILYSVGRVIQLLVSPRARDRELQKNDDRFRREMAAIHRDMQF